jgi:hypothetical protein
MSLWKASKKLAVKKKQMEDENALKEAEVKRRKDMVRGDLCCDNCN